MRDGKVVEIEPDPEMYGDLLKNTADSRWSDDKDSDEQLLNVTARASVALCPELDIASQGATVSEARAGNLTEALELFFECASP